MWSGSCERMGSWWITCGTLGGKPTSAFFLASIRYGGVEQEFVGEKDEGRWRMGMWRIVGYDWAEMDFVI